MTTYYVATLARYVLVDADDRDDAAAKGRRALHELYAERLDREVPIHIRTIRPATNDEIEFWNWHQEMVEREARRADSK